MNDGPVYVADPPAKVDAALRFTDSINKYRVFEAIHPEEGPRAFDPLTRSERRAYESGLEVLRNYFTGKNGYGDPSHDE